MTDPSQGDGPRPLAMLAPGEEGIVVEVQGGAGLGRRLAAMGLCPGRRIKLLRAGCPGPVLVIVGDTRLGLGRGVAQRVIVA